MSANVVELSAIQPIVQLPLFKEVQMCRGRTKPSGVMSVDANPPGVSFESMIIHDGPSCALGERRRFECRAHGSAPAD